MKNTIRIAIVGGGLAGLTAAHLLRKRAQSLNLDIHLFESTDRLSDDLYSEVGAISIHDTDRTLLTLIRDLDGLSLLPGAARSYPLIAQDLLREMAVELHSLRVKKIITRSQDWVLKQNARLDELDSMTLIEYFVQKGHSDKSVQEGLSATQLAFYLNNIERMSAFDALRYLSQYLHSRRSYSIDGGNELLAQVLAKNFETFSKNIFLNTAVTSVSRFNGKWQLTFNKKESELFEYVVMSAPLSYLQSHEKNNIKMPHLSAEQQAAIDAIKVGQTTQQGSYAYLQPGQRHLLQLLQTHEQGLFFAGEHTSMDKPVSMNGAVESAYRVVNKELLPTITQGLFGPVDTLSAMPMKLLMVG